MHSDIQSFIDASPEKGVIDVEYYWDVLPARHGGDGRARLSERQGYRNCMALFKRIRAADKCWCGRGKTFARCHRRSIDWTYVTIDPDQRAYSPVILLDRTFDLKDTAAATVCLESTKGLLPFDASDGQPAWGVTWETPVENEHGTLILGSVELARNIIHLETNSDRRLELLTLFLFDHLTDQLGPYETRRLEPQAAINFPVPKLR